MSIAVNAISVEEKSIRNFEGDDKEKYMKTKVRLPNKLFGQINKFDRKKLKESQTILRDKHGNGTLGRITNGKFIADESKNCRVESSDVDFSGAVPRFDLEDPEWEDYLKCYGYVVIKNIIDMQKVEELRNDVYTWCENHPSGGKVFKRDEPETWRKSFLGDPKTGIVWASGAGQADHLWKLRGEERVQRAFKKIWNTDRLLTSFDVFNLFRPWAYDEGWRTSGGWFHVDQNGNNPKRQGLQCVQGLVNLYDADETTGGLTLIPKSHLQFLEMCARSKVSATFGDYIPVHFLDPLMREPYVKKFVNSKAGDLCLWDSRTIHCNSPGITPSIKPVEGWHLLRICLYVCMTPLEKATGAVLAKRLKAYETHCGTSHWPHLFVGRPCGHTKEGQWNTVPHKLNLTPEMEVLIAGEIVSSNSKICEML